MTTFVFIHDPADLGLMAKKLEKDFVFFDFSYATKRMTVFFPHKHIIYYTIISVDEAEKIKKEEKSLYKILVSKLQKHFGFVIRPIPASFPVSDCINF